MCTVPPCVSLGAPRSRVGLCLQSVLSVARVPGIVRGPEDVVGPPDTCPLALEELLFRYREWETGSKDL